MTMSWPKLFGSQSSSKKSTRERPRPVPVFTGKDLSYFYASSSSSSAPSTPGVWSLPNTPLSSSPASSRTSAPSPLRNDYFDAPSTSHSRKRSSPPETRRPAVPRRTTYNTGDHHIHYPILRSDSPVSFSTASSTHSNSSSISPITKSILKGPYATPLSAPRRPALKTNHTWHGRTKVTPNKPHVSFVNPKRTETLNMHPILASSRSHPAPIAYNIIYPPSAETLLDRTTRTSLPLHTLYQPATDPVTHSKLVLKSDKFPWTIIVTSQSSRKTKSSGLGSPIVPVTNFDVFQAIHNTLSVRVTQDEWANLGHGSRAQRKASRAYEKRCQKMGGGWDDGVLRVDLLGEKSVLVGVEVDKDSNADEGRVAKLIFAEA